MALQWKYKYRHSYAWFTLKIEPARIQMCRNVYFNYMYISRGGLVLMIGLCAEWICAVGFIVKSGSADKHCSAQQFSDTGISFQQWLWICFRVQINLTPLYMMHLSALLTHVVESHTQWISCWLVSILTDSKCYFTPIRAWSSFKWCHVF